MKYRKTDIKIDVEGGVVQDVQNIPKGIRVVVRDQDAKEVGDEWIAVFE